MGRQNDNIKNMTSSQRQERISDLDLELMRLRAQGIGENKKAVRDIKREIARVKMCEGNQNET